MEKASSRLRMLALLVALLFIALSTRLWFLQVLASERFTDLAKDQSIRFVPVETLRGRILDANGRLLVGNRMSLEVRVNRAELGDDTEAILQHLAEVLGVPVERLVGKLATNRFLERQPVPVAAFVSEETAFFIREHPGLFPPAVVQVVQTSVRDYPHDRLASHSLGHVGLIEAEQFEELEDAGYGLNDSLGRAGLEAEYERWLRGERGIDRYIVNADGEVIRQLASEPPVHGHDLVLAMDLKIQRIAEEELVAGLERSRSIVDDDTGRYLAANGGAVVVMNPNTGGVVAMASWPDFDPRWYVRGMTPKERRYLFDSPPILSPSSNRATQFTLAPGSTFKPFVTLSALRHGVASLGRAYNCPARYVAPGDESGVVFSNSFPADFGFLSVSEALMRSCDTIFYDWGWRFYDRWTADQLGPEPFQKDLRSFGFSRPTKVDLSFESEGLVYGAADAPKNPELFFAGQWQPGGDILISIGSSYVTATPLQLATAYSVIANGGKLCRPHLADRIVTPSGDAVKQVRGRCRSLGYPRNWLQYVRDALTRVTSEQGGTAYYPFLGFPHSQIPVAGKTGTAERSEGGFQDTSWFAAMVPANDPQYVVVVMAEQGGFGSETAAPITRRIIERIYGIEPEVGSIIAQGVD
jgi:penicillin-binding protein 2